MGFIIEGGGEWGECTETPNHAPPFYERKHFPSTNVSPFFSTLIKRRRIVNFSVNFSPNRKKNLEVRPGGIRGRGVRWRRGGHGTRTSRTRITRTRRTRTWWSRRWGRGNGDVLPPDYIQVRHKLIIIFNCIDGDRALPWLVTRLQHSCMFCAGHMEGLGRVWE